MGRSQKSRDGHHLPVSLEGVNIAVIPIQCTGKYIGTVFLSVSGLRTLIQRLNHSSCPIAACLTFLPKIILMNDIVISFPFWLPVVAQDDDLISFLCALCSRPVIIWMVNQPVASKFELVIRIEITCIACLLYHAVLRPSIPDIGIGLLRTFRLEVGFFLNLISCILDAKLAILRPYAADALPMVAVLVAAIVHMNNIILSFRPSVPIVAQDNDLLSLFGNHNVILV